MESCLGVEHDLEKCLSKFRGLGDHTDRVLNDAIKQIQDLKKEISEIPKDSPLTQGQMEIVTDTVLRCKEAIGRLAGDHRDIHASVSRVGKAIDRHFLSDYAAVAPRATQFSTDDNKRLQELAIVQHLYRQGLDAAGDALMTEADLSEETSKEQPFAAIQRIAASLASGDTQPALEWTNRHAERLLHSPLPFTLHTLHMFKIARSLGVGAAIEYARAVLPAHALRHERELQRAVCALAWCSPATAPHVTPPLQYAALLDHQALAASAAELFIKEACVLLRLAPLSPLAGAVLAGCRVLPAMHDIRAKMSHPHVLAAWANKDELPLEVDLGEDGGGYHSVFACPILRQQASEQNPPMRLVCGHVISRDALDKLTQGHKLKCPYCPTELTPAEARQIYFS